MILNKNFKNNLKKILPARLFNLLKSVWHDNILPLIEIKKTIKLLGLKRDTTIETFHKESGVRFKINLNKNNGYVDEVYYLEKTHEPEILSLIHNTLKPGDTYVDIGTNIGGHMLFASVCVGDTGNVIAFEPIKAIYDQAKKSYLLNGFRNISLYNFGLGIKDFDVEININSKNKGNSSILYTEQSDLKEKVFIKNGDSVLGELKTNIHLMKIDVEGYEYDVLLGLKNTFKENKPKNILLELSPVFYNTIDSSISIKILNHLHELGYEIFDVNEGEVKNKIPKSSFERFITDIEKKDNQQTNILATII